MASSNHGPGVARDHHGDDGGGRRWRGQRRAVGRVDARGRGLHGCPRVVRGPSRVRYRARQSRPLPRSAPMARSPIDDVADAPRTPPTCPWASA